MLYRRQQIRFVLCLLAGQLLAVSTGDTVKAEAARFWAKPAPMARQHHHAPPHPLQPQAPGYIVLRHARDTSHALQDAPQTRISTVQPFAYGWFGVAPRRHYSRHFGYYREFTQWKTR